MVQEAELGQNKDLERLLNDALDKRQKDFTQVFSEQDQFLRKVLGVPASDEDAVEMLFTGL